MAYSPLPTDPAAWRRAGERVVKYRYAHGTKKSGRRQPLSQADLATRAGISQGSLQAFENNTRATLRENVLKIADAVGMTLDQLFAVAPDVEPVSDAPLARVHAMLANTFFGSEQGDVPFTDEAIAVARLFTVAHTEIRVLVKSHLVSHIARRKDRAAIGVLEELQLAGLVSLSTETRPTTTIVTPDPLIESRAPRRSRKKAS